MFITILLLIAAPILWYFLAVKPFKYWSERNVPTGAVTPVFGDNLQVILGKESFAEMIERIYNKVADVRYIGVYQFQFPIFMLKSPQLIKQLCVKDFDHFLDHRPLIPDGIEDLWSKNLFSLRGQHWKNMRSVLSPSFTSSKMKSMSMLICQKADSFSHFFMRRNADTINVEFKDAFTRYTNDVIASSAFGVEVDSLRDRENEFYILGRNAATFSTFRKKMVLSLYQLCPSIAGFFRLKLFGDEVSTFFLNLVKDTIKLREERNIKRSDMLGLLIEARKGKQVFEEIKEQPDESSFAVVNEYLEMRKVQTLTDADIASQVFIFFAGGFETVSASMCFMAYELAVNQDVQKRLIDEIDANIPLDIASSYETLMKMPYLDMVVSESLRKWPQGISGDRVVTKSYTIEPELSGETPVHLEVGEVLMLPVFGIHRDPKYYKNPEKFDPERFSPENKKNIDPYTYLPFGVGPRNCIGSRFAILEMKAVFFYILSRFEIVPVEETQIPLRISKTSFNLTSENGFPLGLKPRS